MAIPISVVEAFNHYRGKDRDEDTGSGLMIKTGRLSDFFFFLFLLVWMSAFFHFLYLFFFFLSLFLSPSLVSSMSCSERVRGVWV